MSLAEDVMENGESVSKGLPFQEPELSRSFLYGLIPSPQEALQSKQYLETLGGLKQLAIMLRVDLPEGLSDAQVEKMRQKYGSNELALLPVKSFIKVFFAALKDPVLLILIGAALISCAVGLLQSNGTGGFTEGIAITIAVIIVALVSSINDYSKELQFRQLYKVDARGQKACVLRNNEVKLVHVGEVVVGDVAILRVGDQIPADGILFEGKGLRCNESMLTGEASTRKKEIDGSDPFLYSSCLVSEIRYSKQVKMLVIGLGNFAEWGKIHSNLSNELGPTPLQKRLTKLATYIGMVGLGVATATFITLFISSAVDYASGETNRNSFIDDIVESFLVAITFFVVAVPEGLPLAVTISLAYSTKEMYKSNNLVRRLAACEIMGNATAICTDKTGTLTLNQMIVTEAYIGFSHLLNEEVNKAEYVPSILREVISQNIATNCSSELLFKDDMGNKLLKPSVIGSPTEGALLLLADGWCVNIPLLKKQIFNQAVGSYEYPFTPERKRSTVIVHLKDDKGVRLYCKGASEIIVHNCTACMGGNGLLYPMDEIRRAKILHSLNDLAGRALRTICLAHKDYQAVEDLPEGWETNPPDDYGLIMDAIVGIQDGIRSGAPEAIATAQKAGITVRMITGDNLFTAKAIATACGILTDGGIAMNGAVLRSMTPRELDDVLPKIQVVARASPNDKYLLVTRLNGLNLLENEQEWLDYHDPDESRGLSWTEHRDVLLPGYLEEWKMYSPNRGEVVGVTGDGANDAPALRAADIGIGMGQSGTKVALLASDLIMLDDQFSSIVKAIKWGRCVYDNIRRFLQFQLTVNIVAMILVFVGSVSGKGTPLGAVMMLWVNLIMDSLGALALGTEHPTADLLDRKPYKRSAPLISFPMYRNIIVQGMYQLCILLWILYSPQALFGDDLLLWNPCISYRSGHGHTLWNPATGQKDPNGTIDCATFSSTCGTGENYLCYENLFEGYPDYKRDCLVCEKKDYTHYTIIFNTFVFCQIFNEFNSRSILNDYHVLRGITGNPIFWVVILVTVGCQIIIVEFGGEALRTSSLSPSQWLISSALGFGAIPTGFLMRFIPIVEDPCSFAGNEEIAKLIEKVDSHDLSVPYDFRLLSRSMA